MRPDGSNRRGAALVIVVFVLTVMAGISAAVVSTSLYRYGAARTTHESERAFQAAEAGLDLALYELQIATDLGADGIGVTSGSVMGSDYAVTVAPPFGGPGEYTLTCAGQYGSVLRGIECVVTSDSPFPVSFFGRDDVDMDATVAVDSYESAVGTYLAQVVGDHAGEAASVASNRDIRMDGSAVWGDAIPGPGHQVLGNSANVAGSTAPALQPETFEAVDYSPPLPSAGELDGSASLTTGSYRFDDIDLDDADIVTITGDVVLYVDEAIELTESSSIVVSTGASLLLVHGSGDVDLGGVGIVNSDADPTSVTLRSASTSRFDLEGSSDFHGFLYAPDMEITSHGGVGLFGAAICRRLDLSSGAALHFDESLQWSASGLPDFRVKVARRVRP